jgi:hypothetical protein
MHFLVSMSTNLGFDVNKSSSINSSPRKEYLSGYLADDSEILSRCNPDSQPTVVVHFQNIPPITFAQEAKTMSVNSSSIGTHESSLQSSLHSDQSDGKFVHVPSILIYFV